MLILRSSVLLPQEVRHLSNLKVGAEISLVLLLLAAFAPLCLALEADIQTVADRTLTMNLSPDFSVSQSTTADDTAGHIQQNVTIVDNRHQQTTIASIMVMSFYGEYARVIDPAALSGLMEREILSNLISRGDTEMGSWNTTSKIDQKVMVHTLGVGTPSADSQSFNLDFAFWHLDRTTYIALISALDRNTTDQIIKTTAIE